MAMHKRMISLTTPQAAFLKAEAARLDISVSDLIRRILNDWRGAEAQPRPPRLRPDVADHDEAEPRS
jgi:hypothetical protein